MEDTEELDFVKTRVKNNLKHILNLIQENTPTPDGPVTLDLLVDIDDHLENILDFYYY